MSTSDLAVPTNGTFEELSDGADITTGRLVMDKNELIRKPFIITAARFSPGRGNGDFVSLEITTADNTEVVINDGSTGIRRQIVEYLTAKGWIRPGSENDTDNGSDNPYDNPCDKWTYETNDVELRFDENGKAHALVPTMRLLAKNGLRRSDYTGPDGPASTFYLA